MNLQEFENKINEKLALDNQILGPGVARKLYNEMRQEEATDQLVDRLLKSLGQSLSKNEKLKSEKENKFIDENFALEHLKKCQAEVEGVL